MSAHLDDETLSAFADGAERDVEAQAHVATCADCRSRLDSLARLHAMLGLDADVAPSAGFEQRVMAAVRAERGGGRRFGRLIDLFVPAFGAAFAVAIALGINLSHSPATDELFLVEHQEMLSELELLQSLDAVEDFEVIAHLGDPP